MILRDEIGACLTGFDRNDANTARMAWLFPSGFTGFQGHFTGNPVCPGVCLIMAQLEAASRLLGRRLDLLELKNVKFMWPVFPDKRVDGLVQIETLGNAMWQIKAELRRGQRRIAKLSLLAKETGKGSVS